MHENQIFDRLFQKAQRVTAINSARIVAAVVLKNSIISYGINQRKSHPFQAQYAKNSEAIYLHAEIDAIKNALRKISTDDLKKATLYICRAKRNNKTGRWEYGLAKPCLGCKTAISEFGISKVEFSENGKWKDE